jgi:diacylglycerol kinase (ATP)
MSPGISTASFRPAFIVNRNAGRLARDPKLARRLVAAVGTSGVVFSTGTLEELDEAARRVVLEGASPVVLCGGDGTYFAGVTALSRAARGTPLPPLVLARAGTVSVVARNWGGQRDVVATIRRVAERPESLRYVSRPTIAVDDGTETRIGFTFGTGLVARFFTEYERAGAGGNRAALAIALRVFVDSLRGGSYASRILSPLPCRVSVDGVPLAPAAFSLVLASVLRDVGLHMLVTHRAAEDPERPHLVASPLSPRELGPQWPRVARGKRLLGKGNFDGLVSSFRVDFPSADGPYVLDGDMFHAASVTVRAGPRLRIAT